MTFLLKSIVAILCSGLFLAAQAQDKTPFARERAAVLSDLKEHAFDKLQSETDQWLHDYEQAKITGDEFIERMAWLHPENVVQITPNSDAELWIEKYPKSYAAHYLFGVVLSRTAVHDMNPYSTDVSKRKSQFENYSKLAEVQLLHSATLFARPYPSYYRLIQVARDRKNGMATAFFESALKIDPQAYGARAALVEALAPKSGGSIAALNAAVARSKIGLLKFEDQRKLEALKLEIMGEDAKKSDTEAAIEFYRKSYRTYAMPDTLWRLVEAGEIARQKAYYDRAIELYSQVLEIDPANITARSMRAHVFAHRKSDLQSALPDYAIAINAGYIYSQIELGDIYMDGRLTKADYDLAASYFQMAAAKGNPTGIMKLKELEKKKKAGSAAAPTRTETLVPSWIALLEVHEFQKLETMASGWLQEYTDNKITGDELVERLTIIYPDGSFKSRWQKDVELWLEQYPESYVASHVRGELLAATAQEHRGAKFVSQTPVQQLADYQTYLNFAEKQLLHSVTLFAKPYPSYCTLIKIRGSDGSEYYRLALKIDSKAFCAHATRLQYLAPKWGGSISEVDAAIAASKSSGMSFADNRRIEAIGLEIKADDAKNHDDLVSAIVLYRNAYFASPGPARLGRLLEAANIARRAGYTERAIDLYGEVIGIDKANVRALMARAQMHENEKRDPKAALADFVAAAAAGNAGAQNEVGRMYMFGIGMDRNFDLAEAYFRKAEAQGDQYAVRNLEQLKVQRGGTMMLEPTRIGGMSVSPMQKPKPADK